jgi:hypothetical protein
VLGKASSGLRCREDETRGYSWSECSELVREEWLVDDGGSKGGGMVFSRRVGSLEAGVVWGNVEIKSETSILAALLPPQTDYACCIVNDKRQTHILYRIV